ncbi:ROK family protein [Bacillus sinesaloumensis]|uniref:ROK family protein n=1 Tax=Litchfieldia sinesaloumensis TaxID=1926280 RepID=UPI00098864BC|nr:ROK family protein [Bacillus sinesaloumensis]
MLIGGIEAGGTKFVCGVGNENGEILERVTFPTTTPEETMAKVISFFHEYEVKAIGVGSFGPVDVDIKSETYGYITQTPKVKWKNYDMLGELKKHFSVPMGFHTDVTAAALAESIWGAAKGLDSCIYMTVGTGIGVGAVINGKPFQGLTHPEMGHIIVKRHPRDTFEGFCPYHGDCLEGLAAGPSLEKRWNKKGKELTNYPEVWEIEAYYLAQGLMNYILVLSPKKVIVGGGVMKQEHLLPLVRKQVLEMLNGYVDIPELTVENIDTYIVLPEIGDNAGLAGAIALGVEGMI